MPTLGLQVRLERASSKSPPPPQFDVIDAITHLRQRQLFTHKVVSPSRCFRCAMFCPSSAKIFSTGKIFSLTLKGVTISFAPEELYRENRPGRLGVGADDTYRHFSACDACCTKTEHVYHEALSARKGKFLIGTTFWDRVHVGGQFLTKKIQS